MKTSKQINRDARQLFRLCVVNGLLDEQRVRQVVQGVLRSNCRGSYGLLSHFLRFVKLDRSRHTAEVESATSLPAELQDNVLSGLDHIYGPGITTTFSLNPALIGGMRVRVASDVYDGSIKAGLAALERRF